MKIISLLLLILLSAQQPTQPAGRPGEWTPLFKADGRPEGWVVTEWSDVAKPVEGAEWTVTDGILRSGDQRGTWLISEREYGDFILELEIKLTELGNSGTALRAPMHGDPAFDGLEFQVADVRYNPEAKDSELTGGIYRAIAPTKQVYRPEQWNQVRIELNGTRLKATLNGELIQDIDLSRHDEPVPRHDGNRPRRSGTARNAATSASSTSRATAACRSATPASWKYQRLSQRSSRGCQPLPFTNSAVACH